MFIPDIDIAGLTSHISYMFHVQIGLDPLGDFSNVRGLSYSVQPFEYKELGRNHSPVMLPFDGPGAPGEVTLQWGMVVRSKLWNWIDSVRVGGDFRKNVYIFQLSQQRLPLRLYQLTGCWPRSWEASELTTDRAEWTTEELVLVYDQMDMFNMSAIAMAGGLLGSPLNAAIEDVRPPGFRPRRAGPETRDSRGFSVSNSLRGRKVYYTDGNAVAASHRGQPSEPLPQDPRQGADATEDTTKERTYTGMKSTWDKAEHLDRDYDADGADVLLSEEERALRMEKRKYEAEAAEAQLSREERDRRNEERSYEGKSADAQLSEEEREKRKKERTYEAKGGDAQLSKEERDKRNEERSYEGEATSTAPEEKEEADQDEPEAGDASKKSDDTGSDDGTEA